MKKALVFILAMVVILCLCACGDGQIELPFAKEFTFPESTSVLGVDVTGLTKEEAWLKLESAATNYVLDLTVDEVAISITAQDIDLSCNQTNFFAAATAMEENIPADFSGVIHFNESKLRQLLSQHFNKDVTEASISFDEAAGQYILVPHANGQKSNANALLAALNDVICTLTPQQSLTGVSEILYPVRSADMPEVQEALELANRMISVQLSYTYDGSEPQQIPAETLRSFVILGEDGLTPVINDEIMDAYITEVSEQHSIAGSSGSFKTTGGSTVDLTVSYNGLYVDNEGLKNDIITCMQEGISETRTAPYVASGRRDMAYGGTYIEVDLTSQKLYFYKNGELLVNTPLVSGKVSAQWCTPTGVYSIYSKSAGAYLTGEDYRTYVNYWMPFYYGYGLHDATWRGSFGGEIYLYSGSHGCVNLPLKAAATIFDNASVGTKVILYGGKRSVPPVTQVLNGTFSYDVADDTSSFKLNIKAKYGSPKLTYKSSNSKVATVDESGNISIKGIGNAKITVSAEKYEHYTEQQTTVTINVHSACQEGRHSMGKPTTVTAPTCQAGVEKISCTKCSHSIEQEMAPVKDHSYGEWVITKEPTCTKEGSKERTCSICKQKKETATISATGKHTESDWVTTKDPTCVAEGSKQTKCTVCGNVVKTETIAATGKHKESDWITTQKPTCVEDGSKQTKCTVCDMVMQKETIPATGNHTAGDWQTVNAATCTESGSKVKKCTTCGKEMETATIEAGHKPGDWKVTAATCTASGIQTKSCTVCGTTVASEELPKASHSFKNGQTCENCSEPNPNYVPPTEATEPATEATETTEATEPATEATE